MAESSQGGPAMEKLEEVRAALFEARGALSEFRDSCTDMWLHESRVALGALAVLQEYIFRIGEKTE